MAPNRLQRDFTAQRPNQVWVSDLTYLRVGRGWLYLVVFDQSTWPLTSAPASNVLSNSLAFIVIRTLSQALDSPFCLLSSSPISLKYLSSSESGSWYRRDSRSRSPASCSCSSLGFFPSFNR